MKEVRCQKCGGLLCRAATFVGSIRCHRCKTINELSLLSQRVLTTSSFTSMVKPTTKKGDTAQD